MQFSVPVRVRSKGIHRQLELIHRSFRENAFDSTRCRAEARSSDRRQDGESVVGGEVHNENLGDEMEGDDDPNEHWQGHLRILDALDRRKGKKVYVGQHRRAGIVDVQPQLS